jgi:hypothetical protein
MSRRSTCLGDAGDDLDRLREAADLYAGDLLDGWYRRLAGSADRDRYRQRAARRSSGSFRCSRRAAISTPPCGTPNGRGRWTGSPRDRTGR